MQSKKVLRDFEGAVKRAEDLINFIDASPTSYQAAESEKAILEKAGFKELKADQRWELAANKSYYIEFSDACVFAFRTGSKADKGFHIIGAHNDSPGFQLKEKVDMTGSGYGQLNVEPYGGLILRTWLDRPLSVAGRLVYRDSSEKGYAVKKMDLKKPLMVIPSLAIHINRDVNENGGIKPQYTMAPVWTLDQGEGEADFIKYVAEEVGLKEEDILDYDLYLYDVEKGRILGPNQEFISVGRLDNLAMCHAAVTALTEAGDSEYHRLIALHDNEEIGSMTRRGADSASLRDVLARIVRAMGGDAEDLAIALAKSFTISADMAHALHPSHVSEADPTNRPVLNGGPVLKYAACKSYISDGEGAARVRLCAEKAGLEMQTFHNHSDKRGGATIGSMDEQWTTILNADIGNPVLGMHSVREMGGTLDHSAMIKLMTEFFNN